MVQSAGRVWCTSFVASTDNSKLSNARLSNVTLSSGDWPDCVPAVAAFIYGIDGRPLLGGQKFCRHYDPVLSLSHLFS